MPTPDHGTCSLCMRARRVRRALCKSCYRKLRQHNLPLPAPGKRGRPAREPRALLVAEICRWPRAARIRLVIDVLELDLPETEAADG